MSYLRHVQSYYVNGGQSTSEQDHIRQVLRFVRPLSSGLLAVTFGPVALADVR
ncbi:hypothetical protein V5E97_33035 [Singulisphaera sp. Ch08]|uniref:Uncharacterized protein n=1 Tax=Singulisphaera sp. Ch08 TaxID=3120278 RepID=A0AAU7CDC8_9BACT